MLTIMKYEIIRQRLSKYVMLGLLGVLEVFFLIFLWLDKTEFLGYTIAGLVMLAFFSFIYVSLESIINYNQDLSRKSGYLLFMTPNSVYEILGAKIMNSICTIVATAVLFGAAALLDPLAGLRFGTAVAEEEAERVDHLVLLLGLDGHFDIDHRLDGILCRIGEVGIV